jgi:glycosyltransferase involved in cell wall biosynthesis
MMRKYAAIYGAEGSVLYPSRAAGAARYAGAPERLRTISGPFTCVFAGTINVPGMVTALQRLARALATIGGRLLIYGPLTPSDARTNGLALANIELGGLIPSEHLMDLLRERADALFAPMSFDPADRDRMEIGFPSKLTDYTSVGLPLLIYGPPYCSAVQWSGQNLGAAEVVSEEDSGALASAVSRLAHDAEYRMSLAKNALIAGDSYFSHDAAVGVFHKALLGDTLNEAYGASGRCYFSPEKKMAE